MPYYDSLINNTVKGYALSSIYGGGTPNSEYEFLTGNTMAFLPFGSIAYQQFVKSETSSMVRYLESINYKTYATHPYHASGWLRTAVYPYLGFDGYSFLDDYHQANMIRKFVSDQEMYEYIVHKYEESDVEQQFIFSVSMQNHGSYDYVGNEFVNEIQLEGYSQAYPDVEQYLTLIHKSDEALEYLIEYFERVDEPVVVVLYGDHFPSLNNKFYEEVHGGSFDTLDEQILQYKVPFMIWANYDIEEEYVECTSLNYLSNYLYKVAGIPMPAYNQILCKIEKKIPAINALGYYSLENERFQTIEEASGEEACILNEYAQLQYNCIFDIKNRSKILFPTYENN